MDKLIVVVPVYNEEGMVDAFLDRLAGVAAQIGLAGLVVVDDGSRDQTVTRIEARAGRFPVPVQLVRLSRNFGHQPAVVAGCRAACALAEECGATLIGVIDGDLQDRPEDFVRLLARIPEHDVVYAVRESRRDGWIMRTLAPLFYRLLSASASFPIPENAGTFSVLRLPVCRLIVESADADPYFPGLRAWAGFRQVGVPLERQARAQGTSKVGLRGLVKLSFRAFLLYSDLPLRLVFWAGIALSLGMGCLFILVVLLRLIGVINPSGVTTIIVLQLASLGVTIFLVGLMAFMINRVKVNTSRQERWVVMEQRRFGPAASPLQEHASR